MASTRESLNDPAVKAESPDDNASSQDAASTVKTEPADVDDVYSLEEETIVKEEMDIGPTVIRPVDIQYMLLPCKPEPVQDATAGISIMLPRTMSPPGPGPSSRVTPRCRSNMLQMAIEEGFSNVGAGYNVHRTPRGSLRPIGEERPLFGAPGGSVRRVRAKSPAKFWAPPEERAELADLSDGEVEDLIGNNFNHIHRWLRDSDQPSTEAHHQMDLPMEVDVVSQEERELSAGRQAQEEIAASSVVPKVRRSKVPGRAGGTVETGSTAGIGGTVGTGGNIESGSAFLVSLFTSSTPQRAESPVPGPSGFQINHTQPALGSELDSEYDDELDFPDRFAPEAGGREILPDDDEQPDASTAMLAEAERIMDEAQKDLPVNFDFKWKKNFSTFRGTRETFTGGPSGPTKLFHTPYDAFTAIWDEGIMQRIADETNRYAWQTIVTMTEDGKLTNESRVNEWHETDLHELYVLFGLYIVMGFTPRLRQGDYWRTSRFFDNSGIRSVMSFNRYILLNKFLHFVDNYADVSHKPTKLEKLMPIIRHCNLKFQELYVLDEHVAIDESLTLWKGRLSWVQRIRSTAAWFGIKSYELCESSTGYLWRFIIYTGKGTAGQTTRKQIDELARKTTALVIKLLEGLENKGYYLTMDNFYNSPVLARYLKSRGIDCVGTLRTNRKHVPRVLKLPKQTEEGEIVARHCGDVAVLSWKDKKVVTTISTIHDKRTFVEHKTVKGKSHPVRHVKPIVVRDYNKYMGSIDLKDQKLAMYLMERKRGLKWYVKMFKRLLNVSIHNAYVLHRSACKSRGVPILKHRKFREELAKALVDGHTGEESHAKTISSEIRLKRDIIHQPTAFARTQRRRCAVCAIRKKYNKVQTGCLTCDKSLCFETCWVDYHSKVDLK